MQRFVLMKAYIAAVLLVLVAVIVGSAWPGTTAAELTGNEPEAFQAVPIATQPFEDTTPGHGDQGKQNPG